MLFLKIGIFRCSLPEELKLIELREKNVKCLIKVCIKTCNKYVFKGDRNALSANERWIMTALALCSNALSYGLLCLIEVEDQNKTKGVFYNMMWEMKDG